jgi:hypothetical protein
MTTPERRKHPRIKVYYPISYVCTDKMILGQALFTAVISIYADG